MKAFVLFAILVLLASDFPWLIGKSGNTPEYAHSESPKIEESSDARMVAERAGLQLAQRSGSIIRINSNQENQASIVFNSRSNITLITLGNSTIVKPSPDLQRKLDASLLILTGLVDKGYITYNQTRIICSFTSNHLNDSQDYLEPLLSKGREMYSSRNAKETMHYYSACLNYSAIFELAQNQNIDR